MKIERNPVILSANPKPCGGKNHTVDEKPNEEKTTLFHQVCALAKALKEKELSECIRPGVTSRRPLHMPVANVFATYVPHFQMILEHSKKLHLPEVNEVKDGFHTPVSFLALHGECEAVNLLLTSFGGNVHHAVMGFAIANNEGRVNEYLNKGGLEYYAVLGYAMGGHHEQNDKLLKQNPRVNVYQLLRAYAFIGNGPMLQHSFVMLLAKKNYATYEQLKQDKGVWTDLLCNLSMFGEDNLDQKTNKEENARGTLSDYLKFMHKTSEPLSKYKLKCLASINNEVLQKIFYDHILTENGDAYKSAVAKILAYMHTKIINFEQAYALTQSDILGWFSFMREQQLNVHPFSITTAYLADLNASEAVELYRKY